MTERLFIWLSAGDYQLHAIEITGTETTLDIQNQQRRSVCGLWPYAGWSLSALKDRHLCSSCAYVARRDSVVLRPKGIR